MVDLEEQIKAIGVITVEDLEEGVCGMKVRPLRRGSGLAGVHVYDFRS